MLYPRIIENSLRDISVIKVINGTAVKQYYLEMDLE